MISDQQPILYPEIISGAIRFFCFLSILSGHLTLLWYYPLWSMSFSGVEVSTLSLPLSALFIKYMRNREKMFMFLSLLLGLYIPANMPFFGFSLKLGPGTRLLTSSLGLCISTSLTMTSSIGISWTVGLLFYNLVKFAYVSNNPIWPIAKEFNIFLFVLLFLSLLLPWPNAEQDQQKQQEFSKMSAIKLGSWLYLIDNFMSEPTAIQIWSLWNAFEENQVNYSEIVSILSLILLVFASLKGMGPKKSITTLGMISGLLFLFAPGPILRLIGGILMESVLFMLLPNNVGLITCQNSKTIASGLALYIALMIFHMAGVAYAFLPLGWILRERNHWVFLPCLVTALIPAKNQNSGWGISILTKKQLLQTMATLLGIAVVLRTAKLHLKHTAAPNIPNPSSDPPEISQMILRHFGGLPVVKIGVWALHFGIDSDLISSEKRAARLIESLDLDVIGLVESDLMRPLMGQRDLGRLIASQLKIKYYVDYGPSPRSHTWGCTLLSRHKIVRSKHFLLPSPDGELACAILAEIKIAPGVSVNVLMSHNGQEEDVIGRELQTAFLADLVRSYPNNPLVFAGYLVAKPHSEQYHWLFKSMNSHEAKKGPLTDIDPEIKDRWCLYIGHNQRFIHPLGFVRVHHGGITDTELQAASFAVLPSGLHPPDFEQKWDLILREVKGKSPNAYFRKWYFDEQLSVCPPGGNQVCEHYYHLRRHYF